MSSGIEVGTAFVRIMPLLDPKFNVSALIADFIYRRLVKSEESREWTWRERKLPHG